jgi:hypothetical protein
MSTPARNESAKPSDPALGEQFNDATKLLDDKASVVAILMVKLQTSGLDLRIEGQDESR